MDTSTYKIVTWNVRTLFRLGALDELRLECAKHDFDIVACQEVRWLGAGMLQKKDYTMYYSGSKDRHEFGCAFLLKSKYRNGVMEFQPVNNRICKIRLRGRLFNISIINVHAPSEDKDEETKEEFYTKLERVYDSCPLHDIKIVAGDFNAKVGKEEVYMPTIGKHSLHSVTNDNGERLIHFAASKNAIVMSTVFPHKNIHKHTWRTPDGKNANQIDHICVDSRHRSGVMDIRSFRGPCIDSDHYPVVMKYKQRIKVVKIHPSSSRKKWNIEKLKVEETAILLKESMERKMQESLVDREVEPSIEDRWNKIETIISTVAAETVGYLEPRRRNGWFDNECKKAIDKRNSLRHRNLQRQTRQLDMEYREARREAKSLVKKKKKQAILEQLKDIEEAANKNESRKFYRKIGMIKKGYSPTNNWIKSKDGVLLTSNQEILSRWEEHFQELLNSGSDDTFDSVANISREAQSSEPGESGWEDTIPPTIEEVDEVICQLKRNKAPGGDNINAELVKLTGEMMLQEIHKLIECIWEEEHMPEKWNCGIINVIHKKGDVTECSNKRGITLLNVGYKILAVLLYNRLAPYYERAIGDYQCGFRRNRSTIDQIFALRQIDEKMWEYNTVTWRLFVDFKAAYDRTYRSSVYEAMADAKIPPKLISLTRMTMRHSKCQIRANGELSKPLEIRNGLRQGDALAPILFNLVLDKVVKRANIYGSGTIINKSLQIMAYADDVIIVGRSRQAIEVAYTALRGEARGAGLEINVEKTKLMIVERTRRQHPTFYDIAGENIEVVNAFPYLGSIMTREANETEEVKRRILAGNRTYYALRSLVRSNLLTRTTKKHIYKTLIRPVVTYGSEAWTLNKAAAERIDRFERKVLRRMYGGIREEDGRWRIRKNRELYSIYKDLRLSDNIRMNRLRWYGHINRMSDDRQVKKIFKGSIVATRSKGRPRARWKDKVMDDMRQVGIHMVEDRALWQNMLKQAKDYFSL